MIGLVLGDTHIGKLIIKKLLFLKKKFIIVDISKKKIFKKNKNSFSLSIGQLGKAISILKKHKCKKVIFAGRVEKPNFAKVKFDFKAIYHLKNIIKESKKGDAYIIKLITKIFEDDGIKIIKQTYYNHELTVKKTTYTRIKPKRINKKDINIGKNVINDLMNKNTGQGIVVINGKVIVIEDSKGTDSMLLRAKRILKKYKYKNQREGILLKIPKPNQDMRTDLPTIGIKTLNNCVKAGLKGVVVKAGQSIFLDKSKCINLANKKKMFICGI